MNALKEVLVSSPVLDLPNSTEHMKLDRDACDKQAACVIPLNRKMRKHCPTGIDRAR